MWLAISIGNSTTKVGIFTGPRTDWKSCPLSNAKSNHGQNLIGRFQLPTDPQQPTHEFRRTFLRTLSTFTDAIPDLELKLPNAIKTAVIASVVPQFNAFVTEALPHSIQPLWIDSTWPFSFSNETETPTKVGIDRLISAEAAARLVSNNCVVLDCGTATTLSVLTRSSSSSSTRSTAQTQFIGGSIMPGLTTSHQALLGKTALLPHFEISQVTSIHPIGRNSEAAIRSGVVLGHAAMINGMIEQTIQAIGSPDTSIIATGGNLSLLQPFLKNIHLIRSDLALEGINYLYESIHT